MPLPNQPLILLLLCCVSAPGAPATTSASAPPGPGAAAEARQDWSTALSYYEHIYDSTRTDDATRSRLRTKFAELRPKVPPNTDPAKAGVWKVRAYVFRELDFTWKDKSGKEVRSQHRYRKEELDRIQRGMAAFAKRIWDFSDGNLRIEWTLKIIEQPLTKLDGEDSFWPGPDSCMPFFTDLKPGQVDTIMVFAKAWGDKDKGDTGIEVPQMLLGGTFGSLGALTKDATYIGFNWGSGTANNEPDGEPMVHEWLHAAQWGLEDYQGYPSGLMFTSDGGRMEGEEGGDPCYRRRKEETSWMRFYQHLMRDHVTRRMWRELSVTRPATNVWRQSSPSIPTGTPTK